jgi:lipoate-protein ligase A
LHAGASPRLRHYDWRGAAFTFGYSQKIDWVRAQLPPGEPIDLCRRPTGGGIVDHREDWTFSLVIPRGHPLEEARASESYRCVHDCVARTLRGLGVAVELKPVAEAPVEAGPGVCFQRAEIHDVVHARTGAKIAGAAQKRNKHGILFQGSIWRPAAIPSETAGPVDWDVFHENFAARLGEVLGARAETSPWPDLDDEELNGLVERYTSPEWQEFR